MSSHSGKMNRHDNDPKIVINNGSIRRGKRVTFFLFPFLTVPPKGLNKYICLVTEPLFWSLASLLEVSPTHVWHHSCLSFMALLAHQRAFAAGPFTTNTVSKPDQVSDWWSCQSHHHHQQHHWNDHQLPILSIHAHCTSMNLAIWY